MSDIEKRLRKMEKKQKPLKKFKGDGGESDTKLEPYKRERIDVRDVEDLIDSGAQKTGTCNITARRYPKKTRSSERAYSTVNRTNTDYLGKNTRN